MNKKEYKKPEIKRMPIKKDVSILAGPCDVIYGFTKACDLP